MITVAIHPGRHDAAAVLFDDYRLTGAVQMERLTRDKGAGVQAGDPTTSGWAWACVDELLDMAGLTRRDIDRVGLSPAAFPDTPFDMRDFLTASGLRTDADYTVITPSLCHLLPALFFTDWDEALLYASGGGDTGGQSAHSFRDGHLTEAVGGNGLRAVDSLALAYGMITEILGFRMRRHEGKVTGLAAYGRPVFQDALAAHFIVQEDGCLRSDWESPEAMRSGLEAIVAGGKREDIACSMQAVLEETILNALRRILAHHPHRRLGLAGGLFANVTLNRRLAEALDLEEIFIVPPMGDEGLALGAALGALLQHDGLETWLSHRYRLETLYLGRDHGTAAEKALAAAPGIVRTSADPLDAADHLTAGEIGALYAERMEFGPRALGARTILANPARRDTHDTLNRRLLRSEFMPFAPVVLAERADEIFHMSPVSAYACRFMTMTTEVREAWRERIAAVVHIDHSARPQILRRDQNPLYYDIVAAFAERTGTPVLVNTSFNVHEEPIVNRPAEAITALTDGRIDFLVTPGGVWRRSP